MFRSLFRRNRTIRVPVENSGHQVREVKIFRKALSKPSNFITTFLIGFFVFRILESYTVSKDTGSSQGGWEKWKKEQGLNSASKQDQQLSEHWKKAHEAIRKANDNPLPKATTDGMPPDVISTLTLPIWIRERKSPLYQPSDQEYKDYVRIQSDEKKIAELKKQVGDWAVARLKNPVHEVNMNYIAFRGKVTVVLELVPQLHAPPLYEIPAVIIFKDGIGVGWKILRPDLGTKMEAILRPGVTYAAAKASLAAFFSASYAIMKARMLGGNTSVVQLGHMKPPSSVVSQKELEKDNAIPPMSQWPANTQSMQELLRAVHNGQTTRERHSELIKNLPLSVAVQFAAATFRRRQLHGLAHAQQNSARGVIQVRGAIVCIGERGKYRMDVLAFYLPSEDKFLGPMIIRNAYIVKDYSQWQDLEEKKKKALLDSKNQRQLPKPKTPDEDHDATATEKPPESEEKE